MTTILKEQDLRFVAQAISTFRETEVARQAVRVYGASRYASRGARQTRFAGHLLAHFEGAALIHQEAIRKGLVR